MVVPACYRGNVLSLAHESSWSGHLGVSKTYDLVLKHFFWPGLKADVASHCRSCHVCQLAGKPNQVIRPAPLCPFPALGKLFERVIVDCVGPLPQSKTGNQHLLTIMCASTRFPEAVPLCNVTASSVVRALIKFFSTFGLPKVLQTDQGTNFKSTLFKQILDTLNIKHVTSSAYHPESQGALEHCHQTLKSMLWKFCLDSDRSWDEGIPFCLFAARETVQESLWFSNAELVFGHTVRGPIKVLKEKFLLRDAAADNVLDYVSRLRARLHHAPNLAKEMLCCSQVGMNKRFDQSAWARRFEVGDEVLALVPVPGSSLFVRFDGPFRILKVLSDTDYVVETPDRRRKTRVCRINMLKAYHSREGCVPEKEKCSPVAIIAMP